MRSTMAEDNVHRKIKIIAEFFRNTCQLRRQGDQEDQYNIFFAWHYATTMQSAIGRVKFDVIPLTTGSVAELYIEPMLSCVGDVDVMFHFSSELAIPAGYTPVSYTHLTLPTILRV